MNIELKGDVLPSTPQKSKPKPPPQNQKKYTALNQSGGVWDYLGLSGPVCAYNLTKQLAVLPKVSKPEYQGEMELLLQLGIK